MDQFKTVSPGREYSVVREAVFLKTNRMKTTKKKEFRLPA